jgi:hypothetical protein
MSNALVSVFQEVFFRNRDRLTNPVMDGPMKPNNLLDECPVVFDAISAPDDIAFAKDGDAYVTHGQKVTKFAGSDFTNPVTIADFNGQVTGIAAHPNGGVVACVTGQGIAFIDGPDSGKLLGIKGVSALTCPTALLVGKEGEIYVCNGSADNPPDRWPFDLMEKRSDGQVLKILPGTQQVEILADKLAYPYGICFVAGDSNTLVISEAWSHNLLYLPTDAKPQLKSRRVAPKIAMLNLPGYPSRIIPFGSGYCLTMFAVRTQLVDFVLTEDAFRKAMIESIEPRFWIAPVLHHEDHYLEPVQGGGLKKHGKVKDWAPPRSYGLVVTLDDKFEPVTSLHSRVNGACHGITGVAEYAGKLFITSKGNNKIIQIKGECLS